MEIRQEYALSKGESLPQSPSLPDSDKNEPRKVASGAGNPKVSPKRWFTKDMKQGAMVLNPRPLSQFDPKSGDVVSDIRMKPGSVKVSDVMDKDKVQAEAPVVKQPVKAVEKGSVEAEAPVVKKPVKAVEKRNFEAEVPAVKKPVKAVEKGSVEAEAPVVKKPVKAVYLRNVQAKASVVDKSIKVVEKDKAQSVDVPKSAKSKAAKSAEKCPDVSKPKVKASDVSKPKQKPKLKVGSDLDRKRKLSDEASDEGRIVVKKVKSKKVSDEGSSKKLKKIFMSDDDDDMESLKRALKKLRGYMMDDSESEDEAVVPKSKKAVKKPKGKIKREGNDEDEAVLQKSEKDVKKTKGKIKMEGSDEDEVSVENPRRLGKKKMLLSQDEAEKVKYLAQFPTLRVRNAPFSLFASIRKSKVNMGQFLPEIGFQSFSKIYIDQLPSKLGRFVAAKFMPASNKLNLFNGLSIHVTPQKIHEMLGIPVGGTSLFSFEERLVIHPFVKSWVDQFYPKSLKDIRAPDIARMLVSATTVDDFFKLNFLMLFSNTMGRCETMSGNVCLDVVRRIPEHLPIAEIDWCGYIHHCLQYSYNPKGECHYTGPLAVLMLVYLDSTKFEKFHVVRLRPAILNWSTTLIRQRQDLELADRKLGNLELNPEWTEADAKDSEGFIDAGLSESSDKEVLFNKVEEKLSLICSERRALEADLVKAYLNYADDEKFVELYERYSQLFKKPVSLGNNGGEDNDEGSDGEDDNGGSDGEDGNGGNDDEDIGGFKKNSLDDFDKDPSQGEREANSQLEKGADGQKETDIPADIEKPAENVVGDEDLEFEITNTPETCTQWLEKNVDFLNEGEALDEERRLGMPVENQGPATPERVSTRASKGSPEVILPEKRAVKPFPFLCSPYMNKKTKVVPFITKPEFIVGNRLFSMLGDKIENVFETNSMNKVSAIRLNIETLTPGLWLDANVVDCWGAILNHEESFKEAGSPSRHFFPTGCITKPMIDGVLNSDQQWDSFHAQVTAQFKSSVTLKDVDLAFFPICYEGHFYVVVLNFGKTPSMTILDNIGSGEYKKACDLLKKMFARCLKFYGHKKHAIISKLQPKIPKLKWRTKSNFRDCGIFAMLHMESFMGEAPTKWDCGLVAEYKLQFDMLKRLRFKFATKILLHELNVHREKMLEEAKEFDKLDTATKFNMIVEAVRNREKRELVKPTEEEELIKPNEGV